MAIAFDYSCFQAKPKPKKIRAPYRGSWCDWLSTFEVGERRYVETTAGNHHADLNAVLPHINRRPKTMRHMVFTRTTMTAVGTKVGDVRYLICVERVE